MFVIIWCILYTVLPGHLLSHLGISMISKNLFKGFFHRKKARRHYLKHFRAFSTQFCSTFVKTANMTKPCSQADLHTYWTNLGLPPFHNLLIRSVKKETDATSYTQHFCVHLGWRISIQEERTFCRLCFWSLSYSWGECWTRHPRLFGVYGTAGKVFPTHPP